MKGEFISTDIRYRSGLAMVESKAKAEDIGGMDSVMDLSGADGAIGGEDIGNLYETLDKIVEGVKSSAASVTKEDVSLSDLMGMIGEGGEKSKDEEGVVNDGISDVKSEGGDVVVNEGKDSAETNNAGEAAKDSAPLGGDSANNDSVITIGNSVEADNAGGNSNVSGSVGGDVNNAYESGCSGETVSAIPPIPKYRLREIFRYAEGNCIDISLLVFGV